MLKMPPPLTGATYMNSVIYNSELLNSSFAVNKIGISYSKSVKELGTFQIRKAGIFLATFFRLLKSLIFKSPDIIYFQPSITGLTYYRDLILILTGKIFGKKFILHLHGKGILESFKKRKLNAILYKLGFNHQYLIVLSEKQKSDVAFLNPKKIIVVNNGIGLLNNSKINKTKRNERTAFKFLFLSNLLKDKGVFDLLESAKQLKKAGYNFVVDMVGSEGDISKTELLSRIKEYELTEHCFYHGPKYNEDKIHYFENADAFIFPTRNEAFGLVLLEAMQFSLPIIATDEGAIPEIVETGKSGYIYKKENKEGLQNYMSEFINNPKLVKEFGARGRSIYFEKFTVEKFEKSMLHVFNTTLKEIA